MQVEDKIVDGQVYEAIESPHGNCLGCVAWRCEEVDCDKLITPDCAQKYVWKIKDVTESEATEEDDRITIEDNSGLFGSLTKEGFDALLKHPKVVEAYQKLYPPAQKEVTSEVQGVKYDDGKTLYSLVPPYALEAVAKNLTVGLKKYPARNNWMQVDKAEERYLDALYRHLEAHRRGEIYDTDNIDPTTTHLSAVAVNAMFLLELMLNPELNKGETK